MEIGFDIQVETGKQADDVADQVLRFLTEIDIEVSDYWVEIT